MGVEAGENVIRLVWIRSRQLWPLSCTAKFVSMLRVKRRLANARVCADAFRGKRYANAGMQEEIPNWRNSE